MSFCEHSCGYSTSFLIDPWNFYVLQYPWKFHVSSTAVTCLAWIFSGIAHCFRIECIRIELGSHLKNIQNCKYWEVNFLTSVFQAGNSRKIYQKRRISMYCNSKLYWSKTHEIKSKYKFNLYFTFKIINIHNRSCRKLFFLPLLNPLFHYSNLLKVFYWPCTSQKAVCSHQNSFFLQNKGLNNPI